MVSLPRTAAAKAPEPQNGKNARFHYFSRLLKRRVVAGSIGNRIGTLTDLVFAVAEPYPELVGIYLDHGWGKPTEFIPWDKVAKIEDDAIFVQPNEGPYPPFVDQPGWIMVDHHLMGRTILDIDGRRIEVVNDVRLLEARGRLVIFDVDLSFNGFLRRWHLAWTKLAKDDLISWKYVQPLSLEDAIPTDRVKLSVTRNQLQDLPSEDLADALEELSGKEQQALFSALEPDVAADTLTEAEPRAQRQLSVFLTADQARGIFEEMTTAQLANLFAALPQQKMMELIEILPPDRAKAVRQILSDREANARALISTDFVARRGTMTVGELIKDLRAGDWSARDLSYIYVVEEDNVLTGVVDLRELVLSKDEATLSDIMGSPVVAANENDMREELSELFEKYEYRMIPVVDGQDHVLGVIRDKDVLKRPELNT